MACRSERGAPDDRCWRRPHHRLGFRQLKKFQVCSGLFSFCVCSIDFRIWCLRTCLEVCNGKLEVCSPLQQLGAELRCLRGKVLANAPHFLQFRLRRLRAKNKLRFQLAPPLKQGLCTCLAKASNGNDPAPHEIGSRVDAIGREGCQFCRADTPNLSAPDGKGF